MKVSLNWLREFVAGPLDGETVANKLTMAGLEVESRTPWGNFSGVIAAEVRGKKPHPDAKKLTLVDVFDGETVTQVVCGAPNVPEPGAIVLWARPGARLPDGRTLEAREVRGVVSPGMLCAEDELGFGESHEGILVCAPGEFAPGQAIALGDEILEVNVTPNRPDCLGHLGIAREIAALHNYSLRPPAIGSLAADGEKPPVTIEDVEGCPRYSAIVLDGAKLGPSPLAVRLRLQSLGVRAISNVVDATNLVLLELGQPLHAFDRDKLAGGAIVVRRPRRGESLTTLDGCVRALADDDLVIADAEKPVALAGVMGGATSEVSSETTRILLESAYFAPARVRRTSKRLGLHTEASHRFERGCDPAGVLDAGLRCAQKIAELSGARLVAAPVDVYPKPIEPWELMLRPSRTRALLGPGPDLDEETQARALESIGLAVDRGDGRTGPLRVIVPPRRPDLTREVDLIEEVARLVGYDLFAPTIPVLQDAPPPPSEGAQRLERARDALMGLGLEEIVTYAFVSPSLLAQLSQPEPVKLANPLREEQSAMRTTMVPGLLGALERNLSRGQSDVRLFEVGNVFYRREHAGVTPVDERPRVAGILAGASDGWLKPGAPLDLHDIKGIVDALLVALGYTAEYVPGQVPFLHPGVQARVLVGGRDVGGFGELHPDLLRKLEIASRAFVFGIHLDELGPPPTARAEELPRFPSVIRDLSFFVDDKVSAREIAAAIAAARDPLCVEFRVLEDYREKGRVPAGKKGMLWSFTYRSNDRTLTDAEVEKAHSSLRERLTDALQLALR